MFPAQSYEICGGKVRRVSGSEIPDFGKSPFHDLKGFDHEKFEVWGNEPYMLFADYDCTAEKSRRPNTWRGRSPSGTEWRAG